MNKHKFNTTLLQLGNILLHLIAVIAIGYIFYPMAKWYFDYRPIWGVDFYYTASLVNMLKSNLVLPPAGWGYAWFAGWPTLSNYPMLHYYLILPLTYFFPLIVSVKIWMLICLTLFFIGSYAVFFTISRSRTLSFVFSLASIYSIGVYGALMWGGSLPSAASQTFLPWVSLFIILFLKTNLTKHLLTASLLTGLAILGHPQIVIAYIYPTAAILFVFWFSNQKMLSRLKSFITYLTISFLIGLPLFYSSLGIATKALIITDANQHIASSTARLPTQTELDVAAFHHAQPYRIYIDTNPIVFQLLALCAVVFLIGLILLRRFKMITDLIPFIILSIYSAGYIWIFAYGISIYHGGWYRLFWTVPLWVGMIASIMWGSTHLHAKDKLARFKTHFHISTALVNTIILVVGVYVVLTYFTAGIQDKIIARSSSSSAFPDIVNLRIDGPGFESLKKRMVPNWLDANQTNFRLYDADQTVNIWWNALYKMPLARGYFDPPLDDKERGYIFWTDAALSQDPKNGQDQLQSNFKYPAESAFNNTLFLIDWNAVKYFEVHAGPTAYAPLPKALTTDTYLANQADLDFNDEKYATGDKRLHYYALKDQYSSPILAATNAPTLGIVASDAGYETIIRDIADLNFNSTHLIPLKLGQKLDDLSANDLASIDSLIVYDYKYQDSNRVFRLLNDYAKKGHKVLIETGTEVVQSYSSDPLPDFFPINKTYRKSLGSSWDLKAESSDLTKGVDFSKFDPPIFDQADWNLSYPQSHGDIRPNSNIILSQRGNPIMITKAIGAGEVIWSGMNLPYHVSRNHNLAEIAFFKNLLLYLNPMINGPIAPATSDVKFISPQIRIITTSSAKGVLFKEQDYSGWGATISRNGQTEGAKIFKAGPTYPGFIYVPLPQNTQAKITAKLEYRGSSISWLLFWLAVLICLFCLDEILLGSKVLGRGRRFLWRRLRLRLTGWWGKEDEQ